MAEFALTRVSTLPALPARPAQAHKGDFGRVLIVAGSRGMSGAAGLAGMGALRGGAGLVTVAIPEGIQPIVAGYEPSYMTAALPENSEGCLTKKSTSLITELASTASAVAVGPGLSQGGDVLKVCNDLFDTLQVASVFDADALNSLAKRKFPIQADPKRPPRILTPHPGELARLTGLTIAEIQQQRESVALKYARHAGVILVLKGAGTIITDGERLAVNLTGSSGLATGGSGDVLTGVIVALLAQGMGPFEAAQLGAYLQGRAGDLAAEHLSNPGMISSDLPRYVAAAWREILAPTGPICPK